MIAWFGLLLASDQWLEHLYAANVPPRPFESLIAERIRVSSDKISAPNKASHTQR